MMTFNLSHSILQVWNVCLSVYFLENVASCVSITRVHNRVNMCMTKAEIHVQNFKYKMLTQAPVAGHNKANSKSVTFWTVQHFLSNISSRFALNKQHVDLHDSKCTRLILNSQSSSSKWMHHDV